MLLIDEAPCILLLLNSYTKITITQVSLGDWGQEPPMDVHWGVILTSR